jgi:paraquat-inducible protein B
MSKPANKKVIGVFVLGAIGLLIAALLIFGSGKIFKKTVPLVFYFEGSVKGLNIGSAVMIRGVQVGSVTNVMAQFNPQDLSLRMAVYADFDPEKVARVSGTKLETEARAAMLKMLIDRGMRAQLETQSILTGLMMIKLDFFPGTPVRLVGTDPKAVEVPTISTTMEQFSEKLQKIPFEKILDKLANSLDRIETLISSPEVEGGVKNLARSMEEVRKLVQNINEEIKPLSASVQETLKDTRNVVRNADSQIAGTASRLEGVLGDAQKLVQNVDRQVGTLASQFGSTLDGAKKLVGDVNTEVGSITSDLKKMLEEVHATLAQVQKTLQAAEGNYAEGSAFYYDLNETLEGLNKVSRSVQLLAEYLKQHPDAVIWGKGRSGGK